MTSLGSSQQSVLDKKYFGVAVYVSFVNEIPGISSDKKVTKISLFEILYSVGNVLKNSPQRNATWKPHGKVIFSTGCFTCTKKDFKNYISLNF